MSGQVKGIERRNVSGQAYALTLLSPVAENREQELRRSLQALRGRRNPLLDMDGTHFARWVVVGELNYEGPGRAPELPSAYLLFTSVFDLSLAGSAKCYLHDLCESMPDYVDCIWSHCRGFPGGTALHPERFAAWISGHRIDTGYFFASYGEATVRQVREALERRRRLRDFATAHQFSAPETIQRAFRKTFADLDAHL
jgi:hypothetical protein